MFEACWLLKQTHFHRCFSVKVVMNKLLLVTLNGLILLILLILSHYLGCKGVQTICFHTDVLHFLPLIPHTRFTTSLLFTKKEEDNKVKKQQLLDIHLYRGPMIWFSCSIDSEGKNNQSPKTHCRVHCQK